MVKNHWKYKRIDEASDENLNEVYTEYKHRELNETG